MATHPYVPEQGAPRLPNGNVLIPRGATAHQKRSLSPLSPGTSLTGPQKSWITDAIEAATAPLREHIAKLEELIAAIGAHAGYKPPALKVPAPASAKKAEPKAPDPKDALPKTTAMPATSTAPPPPPPVTEAPKTEPAGPALSAPMMALLANVKPGKLKEEILTLFKADKPEATKLAEARGLIAAAARKARDEEALGALNADE